MKRTLFPKGRIPQSKRPKQKRPLGRPRMWDSPEVLGDQIDKYFESCLRRNWELKYDKDGKKYRVEVVTQMKPFTVSGLAVALKVDRQTLLHYEKVSPEFFSLIKDAKNKCQAYAEEYLFSGKSVNGAIFSIKNNYTDWHDTRREEITGLNGTSLGITVNDERAKQSRERLLVQTQENK